MSKIVIDPKYQPDETVWMVIGTHRVEKIEIDLIVIYDSDGTYGYCYDSSAAYEVKCREFVDESNLFPSEMIATDVLVERRIKGDAESLGTSKD